MRLVNADALDSVVSRLNTEGAKITRSEYKMIDNVIFEFPTVEAIPVDWLLDHIPKDEVMHEYNKKLIEYLAVGWREEKKEP